MNNSTLNRTLIFMLLLSSTVQTHVVRSITPNVTRVLKELNSSFNLTCNPSASKMIQDDDRIMYRHEEKVIYSNYPSDWAEEAHFDSRKYKFHGGNDNYSLQVMNAQLNDSGHYTCACDTKEFHKYEVFVADLILSKHEIIKEGDTVVVTCDAKFDSASTNNGGNIELVIKGDAEGNIVTKTNTASRIVKTFTFTGQREYDKSNVSCSIKLKKDGQTISSTLMIDIPYPPRQITIESEHGHHDVGDLIRCSAEANPPPFYLWTLLSSNISWSFEGQHLFILKNMTGPQKWSCSCPNYLDVPAADISLNVSSGECKANHTAASPTGIQLGPAAQAITLILVFLLAAFSNTRRKNIKKGDLSIAGIIIFVKFLWMVEIKLHYAIWLLLLVLGGLFPYPGGTVFSIFGLIGVLSSICVILFTKLCTGKRLPSEERNTETRPLLPPFSNREPTISESDASLSINKEARCLVSRDASGKLICDPTVLTELRRVDSKLVVVAITGLYRTGKSYLMNCLAGETMDNEKGFELGATVQKKTRGLWLWLRQHPHREDVKLILIDTEGIGDPGQRTAGGDKWIFTLVTLISSTLIHNCQGVLREDTITEWDFITELRDKIYTSEGGSFDIYAPNLVVTLRDFALLLQNENGKLEPKDYLEGLLEMKPDRKEEYNQTRKTIRNTFRKRDCFLFDRPAAREHLGHLDTLPKSAMSVDFLTDVDNFTQFVFNECEPMQLHNGQHVSGSALATLVQYCVDAINKDGKVDMGGMMNSVADNESKRAIMAGVSEYKDCMEALVQRAIPDQEAFLEYHKQAYKQANELFLEKLVDDVSRMDSEMLNERIQVEQEHYQATSKKKSREMCLPIANQCVQEVRKQMKKKVYNYHQGLEEFQDDLKDAENEYRERCKDLGMGVESTWDEVKEIVGSEFYITIQPGHLEGTIGMQSSNGQHSILHMRKLEATSEGPRENLADQLQDINVEVRKLMTDLRQKRDDQKLQRLSEIQDKRKQEYERLKHEGFLSEAENLNTEIVKCDEQLSQMKNV